MAKGDVQMKFSAETGAFVQQILKAHEALDKTADKARKTGDDVANSGLKIETSFKKMRGEIVSSAGNMISNFGTIGTAIGLLRQGFDAHMEAMGKKAQMLRNEVQTLNKALGASGQIADFAEVQNKLKTVGGSVFTQKEATEKFRAISEKTGGESSVDEKIRATKAAANAQTAGVNDTTAFGVTFAELAKNQRKGGVFEKYSDNQLEELTAKIIKFKPGGLEDKDVRDFNRGKQGGEESAKRSLDIILARARSSESGKAADAIESNLDVDVSPELLKKAKRTPKKLTSEEQRKIRLNAIPEDQRYDAILKDPTLAPESQRRMITNLASDLEQGETDKALNGSEFGQSMAAGKKLRNSNPEAMAEERARQADIEKERIERKGAGKALRQQTEGKEFRNSLRNAGAGEWTTEALGTANDAKEFVNDNKEALGGVNKALAMNPVTAPAAGLNYLLMKLIDKTDEQTNVMKEQVQAANKRSDTSLESNKEGQK